MSILKTTAGLAGSLFGGYQASRAMKKVRALLNEEQRENQNWYDRRMHQDYTQTAEAQNAMRRAHDYAQQLNRAAEGRQAVMGGTQEAVAAEREQTNEAVANTLADIAAAGTSQKEAIEQEYLKNKRAVRKAKAGLYAQQAQEISKAAGKVF